MRHRLFQALAALTAALLLGGCQSLQQPPAQRTADRLRQSLDVIESPHSSPTQIAKATASYRGTLERALPELLDDPDPTKFSLSSQKRPGWLLREELSALSTVAPPEDPAPGLHRPGLGAPLVGSIEPGGPNAPQAGFRVPVTALALPQASSEDRLELSLANPLKVSSVATPKTKIGVAMDLESPLDATRSIGPGLAAGLRYLLRTDRFEGDSRVTFLQPFDPDKVPIVLIHGLMTTPQMWGPVVKDLLADEVVRNHYQFWFFYYPTGQPVPLSALQLRDALAAAAEQHGLTKPMVLVGYSMGGILARAQVSRLTPEQAQRIIPGVAELPATNVVRRALVFEPRPDVRRIVFMFTPHRGSRLATTRLGDWGIRLIRLPGWIRWELANAVETGEEEDRRTLPTSIHGLSPSSVFLRTLADTAPSAPAHSILGDRGRRGRCSDGVVPCSSARLELAESELIVPTGHGGVDHPKALDELRRILKLDTQIDRSSISVPY